MKNLLKVLLISIPILISGCAEDESSKKEVKDPIKKTDKKIEAPEEVSGSDYGIGPISKGDVTLTDEVDAAMAEQGKIVYDKMCTACHKANKKFIGPAPKGIMERRTPEWIMNMILNPEQMVKEDPIAKQLLIDFNGAPMANQNLTKEEARHVLEYFRTLK
ncbi:MAG: cytochrome c [Bacteroidota bacterium]